MKGAAILLGIGAAIVLHGLVLTFGGILFLHDDADKGSLQQVDLLTSEDVDKPKDKDKAEEQVVEKKEEMQAEDEPPPDAEELMHDLEQSAVNDAPKLDAASLGAIEQALNGGAGGAGDFASTVGFSSGGVIGGTGKAGSMEDKIASAFSLAEIDQKARIIYQAVPMYPSEMRGKKVEGLVTIICIVDATGKVANLRVESSSNPAFEKPALDAVKQWKFEPALRGGQRVESRLHIPIRFGQS
jgi:protein TonB